jgi:hypothetical protein
MGRPKKSDDLKKIIKSKLNLVDSSKEISSKPKKEKKISEEEEAVEIQDKFRVVQRSYPPSSVDYSVYYTIPKEYKIDSFTEVGSRVIVAKYPIFYKIYLIKYIEAGVPHFPRGGIKVYNTEYDQIQYHGYDSVALHPTKKDKYRIATI